MHSGEFGEITRNGSVPVSAKWYAISAIISETANLWGRPRFKDSPGRSYRKDRNVCDGKISCSSYGRSLHRSPIWRDLPTNLTNPCASGVAKGNPSLRGFALAQKVFVQAQRRTLSGLRKRWQFLPPETGRSHPVTLLGNRPNASVMTLFQPHSPHPLFGLSPFP